MCVCFHDMGIFLFIGHLYFLFSELPVPVLGPFFYWVFAFFVMLPFLHALKSASLRLQLTSLQKLVVGSPVLWFMESVFPLFWKSECSLPVSNILAFSCSLWFLREHLRGFLSPSLSSLRALGCCLLAWSSATGGWASPIFLRTLVLQSFLSKVVLLFMVKIIFLDEDTELNPEVEEFSFI